MLREHIYKWIHRIIQQSSAFWWKHTLQVCTLEIYLLELNGSFLFFKATWLHGMRLGGGTNKNNKTNLGYKNGGFVYGWQNHQTEAGDISYTSDILMRHHNWFSCSPSVKGTGHNKLNPHGPFVSSTLTRPKLPVFPAETGISFQISPLLSAVPSSF